MADIASSASSMAMPMAGCAVRSDAHGSGSGPAIGLNPSTGSIR